MAEQPAEASARVWDAEAQEEIRIMQAARANPARFAPIYERYFARIYGYCVRRVATPQEAEDLTSQVFTRALVGLPKYRGGQVAVWLFRIAHNAVVNHLRGRRPQVSLEAADLDVTDDGPEPGARLDEAEALEALRDLVAALPDAQQDLLALKVVAGLTSEEVGAVLGKSAGAVRVELHRVIKKLRAQYTATYGAEWSGPSANGKERQ
ncbi:MAG: sigma-70 family RNA polymerase sigma factor [Anaerolineae bacterium]|nr:sigma-70 family RNA polymerase sigma factor [Anaerolineae bacterium]